MNRAATRSAAAVALLLSAALLAYEILLVRGFAIRYFHHFATMAIGVAMLGFGASGTWVAVRPPQSAPAASRQMLGAALLTPVLLAVCPLLAARVPLDPTQLPSDPLEWPRLFFIYVLLALPFFSGSLAILLAVAGAGPRPGLVYGASFLGSALGVGLAMAAAFLPFPWKLELTPYKELPQVEAFPGARRVAEGYSPVGWTVAVEAPAFRYAPGLSLTYQGDFPAQAALFVDGQLVGGVSRWRSAEEAKPLMEQLPASLPYAVGGRERVLVLGAGGGTDMWAAIVGGARDVVGIELSPEIARFARASMDAAKLPPNARVRWIVGDVRGFLLRTHERFDLITLGAGGAFGTSVAGVYSLNEDFLHTVEAYGDCLERLTPRGLLAITRWLTVPSRGEVRAVLTAAEALRRVAPGALSRGVVVARSWATVTVLVKPSGFSTGEVEALAAWARSRQLDLDWFPGMRDPVPDPFNVLDGNPIHRVARAVASDRQAAAFAASYPFDVEPSTDARPYPHHFLRARSLGSLLRAGSGSWLPFAEWGYIVLLATLVQPLLLGLLLLGLAGMLRWTRRRAESVGGDSMLPLLAYFASIGFAYLAVEIAAIQQLGLLLGHPVYAVAAVLAAMLAFSGWGSAWSDRIRNGTGPVGLAVAAALLGLAALLLLPAVRLAQPAPLLARLGVALLALAPPAFLMGWAFPIGLRRLAGDSTSRRGWAWATNGFASVVAAPLSALIALEAGSPALFALAALAYAAASVLLARGCSESCAPRRI